MKRTRHNRRFQFSLATLLLAGTSIAVGLGIPQNRATRQRYLTATMEQLGGRVDFRHESHDVNPTAIDLEGPPGFLSRILGDDFFHSVNSIISMALRFATTIWSY